MSEKDVITITGSSSVSVPRFFMSVNPSMTGIFTSVTTRS
jgi:hypothetical protein